jgi:glycosyltransferase involved in cell wall biosynthesis
MARVLLLALRFWPATGGVEARLWEVARRLAGQHEITVLCSDAKREQPFERFAPGEAPREAEGVRIVRLAAVRRAPVEGYGVHLDGLKPALRDGFAAAQVLDVHPYGAAHTDLAVPMAKRAGARVALTAHYHPAETAGHPWLRAAYDRFRGAPTLRAADRVVAVTKSERRALRDRFGVADERLRVIPNGVDTKHFRDLGQPREAGLMLAVGRLAPVKGFDLALRVLAKLRADGQDARLIVAGEDWGEGPRLRALAKDLGVDSAVQFAGRVDGAQLLGLYNRASLLLMPSQYEAFGITALEAVACGLPVVAADVGGLRDAVGPGGVCVPRDVRYLASSAAHLLRDPDAQGRLRKAGQAHAAAHDWDRVAAQVGQLWQELAR